MEVGNKCKTSAPYLLNYASFAKNTGTWGVNILITMVLVLLTQVSAVKEISLFVMSYMHVNIVLEYFAF